MEWNLLSDTTSQALAASLRGTAARHAALANNIANVDTPGFVRGDVEFQTALAAALSRSRRAPVSSGEHLAALTFGSRRDASPPPRADGNNVDIDREMVGLAVNALRHRAAGEALGFRIRGLRNAIREGR